MDGAREGCRGVDGGRGRQEEYLPPLLPPSLPPSPLRPLSPSLHPSIPPSFPAYIG